MGERARRQEFIAGAGAAACALSLTLVLPPAASAESGRAPDAPIPVVAAQADDSEVDDTTTGVGDGEPGTLDTFGLPEDWMPTVVPPSGYQLPEDLAIGVRFLFTGEFPVDQLQPGDDGPAVTYVQRRLATLDFRPGAVDGSFGAQTSSAVLAFQKFEGIERTGIVDTATLERLRMPLGRGPRSDLPGPRIEVDLARQVLFVVEADGSWTALNTATGNNAVYHHPAGYDAVAATPTGSWPVYRRVEGWDPGPLGSLYRPLYFTGGFAVHGSNSVPAYPASHGCARTSPIDQDWIWNVVPNGADVTIY